MNAPVVSVIVTTCNSSRFLGKCLESIRNQSYKNIELIVVDNNSEDDSKEIASSHTDKVFNFGPERSSQRNFGVNQSKGEYLLIVDSDMELSGDIVAACIEKIKSDSRIKGVIIPEESCGEGFWAQCKKLERSFYVGVDWMEAARFFDRETFQKMGGYDEENTGTEDYDLPQRIKEGYGSDSISSIDLFIYHDESRLSLMQTMKKKFYYSQKLDRYRKIKANEVYLKQQASIIKRYGLFFSRPYRLFKKPLIGFGMLFMKACEFGAGGLGYLARKIRDIMG
jgi:glycosyltransferase involved in cell wall biosynthesis